MKKISENPLIQKNGIVYCDSCGSATKRISNPTDVIIRRECIRCYKEILTNKKNQRIEIVL